MSGAGMSNTRPKVPLLLATSLALAALAWLSCSSADPEPQIGGSCHSTVAKDGPLCFEYGELAPAALAKKREACAGDGLTWRDAACPAEGRVGGCPFRDNATGEAFTIWSYRPQTEQAVRAVCKDGFRRR